MAIRARDEAKQLIFEKDEEIESLQLSIGSSGTRSPKRMSTNDSAELERLKEEERKKHDKEEQEEMEEERRRIKAELDAAMTSTQNEASDHPKQKQTSMLSNFFKSKPRKGSFTPAPLDILGSQTSVF